jgi:hypothetical protein
MLKSIGRMVMKIVKIGTLVMTECLSWTGYNFLCRQYGLSFHSTGNATQV